ncbi:hypothetical protein FA95DRAFT_1575152 [Auriscalpium vulgare]|uniref:Uncharacterized protein n=1 Tax=Auriscalpium vulgare TaxID=40419 RepID=A0ACB8RI21_9AGAM|nr:hypothetical protein FA95DRAFT_1575152 [Auriscalpium vulgare]
MSLLPARLSMPAPDADPDGADEELRRILEFFADTGYELATRAQNPITEHEVPLASLLEGWDDNAMYEETFGMLPASSYADASLTSSGLTITSDLGPSRFTATESLDSAWFHDVLPLLQLPTTPPDAAPPPNDFTVIEDDDTRARPPNNRRGTAPARANLARLQTCAFLSSGPGSAYCASTSALSTPTFSSPTSTILSSAPSSSGSEIATPLHSPLFSLIPDLAPSPPQRLLCSKCDWVQANGRQSDLARHALTHQAPQLVCTRGCGRKFRRSDGLKRHMENRQTKCALKASRAKEERESRICT